MTRDPSKSNRRLPLWLRDVPLPPRPADAADPGAFAATPPAPANWMDSLRSPVPPEPESSSALPSWLQGLSDDEDATVPQPAASGENEPPWLQGGVEEVPATDSDVAGETPEWLRGLSADEPVVSTPGAMPPWLQGDAEETPITEANTADDGPAWLRGADADVSATPAEEVPSWLRGLSADEPAASAPEAVPSWLQGDAEEALAPEAGTEAGAPSWLRDTGADTSAADADVAEPSWLREDTGAQLAGGAEAVPSWLQGLSADEPPAVEEPLPAAKAIEPEPDSEPEDATPDDVAGWFAAIDSEEVRRVMESEDEGEDADAPALEPFSFDSGDTGSNPSSPPAPPSFAFGQPSDSDNENSMPDWLSGLSAGAEAPTTDTSAWSFEPPASAAPAAGAGAGADDVPAWLRDIGAQLPDRADIPEMRSAEPPEQRPAEVRADAAIGGEDMPEWLRDAGQSADTAVPTAPSDAPVAPAEDVPSWLQDASATPAPAAPSAPSLPDWLRPAAAELTPSAAADDVPSWLQDASATPAPAAPSAPDLPNWLQPAAEESARTTPGDDVPSWLQDVSATPAPAASSAPDLPSWLTTPGETPAAADAIPVPQPVAPDLPDWLTPKGGDAPAGAPDLPPWLRDESGRPLPTAGAPGDANLPPWLQGAPTTPAVAAPSASAAPAAAPVSLDWLEEDTPAPSGRETTPSGESGFFGNIDVPAWLGAEPTKPTEPTPDDVRSLDWLRKIGAPEEDAAPTISSSAPRLAPPRAATRTPAQVEALALLRSLAAAPFPESPPVPIPAPATVWQRVGLERVLYIVLLVALIIGLVVPGATAGIVGTPEVPGVIALQNQINTLTENDIVLIAYEWDARRVGELRPLERALFDHLVAQQVKIVLISTDPQGALLQFDARDLLTAAQYQPGGQDYVLLGYRPGGDLALRLMAQDFRTTLRSDFQGDDATIGALSTDLATGEPRLQTLRDFSHVIVMADDVVDVQGWMEQVYPSLGSAAGRVPLTFLLPTETAPIVQPYTRQPGVAALIGQEGALAYDIGRGAERGAQAGSTAVQLRFALLAFVALLLIGAVIVGIDEAMKRRRRA